MNVMKTMCRCLFLILVMTGMMRAYAGEPVHRADWMQKAQWGIFVHYLYDCVKSGDDRMSSMAWNRIVSDCDVEAFAERVAYTGAGYVVWTLGQNSGYYCSPNSDYDKYTRATATNSKCSKRDLIADVSAALKKRGIRMMAYLPAGAPDRDVQAMTALEWQNGKFPLWTYENGKPKGEDPRLAQFQTKWESVIREWSKRWGESVSGWWFDGCYFPDAMYRHPEAPNFASFAAAARAGNENSIVAFNPGVVNPIITLTDCEDYTAGEINDPMKVNCEGPRVGTAQFHMLTYMGPNWAQSPARFTKEQVVEITKKINAKGGAVTWEVPVHADGGIPQEFVERLRALGEATGKVK
jgi:alpha-L-fucosidase